MDINIFTENYKFKYKKINIELNQVSPLLELKRLDIIRTIVTNINTNIIKYKYNKLSAYDIVRNCIFTYIAENTYYIDPMIPYNYNNFEQIKKNFKLLYPNRNFNNLIDKLDIKNNFNNGIDEIREYIRTDFYIDNLNNINVNKKIENNNIYISMLYNIEHIQKYEYLKFCMNINLYNNLKKKYIKKQGTIDNLFDIIILCLNIRYYALEANNEQLANYPKFYKELKDKCGFNYELYASFLNSYYDNFCSLFLDLEQYFGSYGSFNNINIIEGLYVCNPPFYEELMEYTVLKILEFMKSNKLITILLTIPAWKSDKVYGEYKAYEKIKKSEYLVYSKYIPKRLAKYYDYYNNRYINPCNMYFLLLQNHLSDFKQQEIVYNIKDIIENLFYKTKYENNKIDKKSGGYKFNKQILKHTYKYDITEDIKYINDGYDYKSKLAKKYYKKEAYNKYILNITNFDFIKNKILKRSNIEYNSPVLFVNNIFNDFYTNTNKPKNICIIDITPTYNPNYIINRNKLYYELISNFYLKKDKFFDVEIKYILNNMCNEYNILKNNNNIKYDFICIGGTLEAQYYKHIYYYLEHINIQLFFTQILFLLLNQNKNGNFIMFFYTIDLDVMKKIILLVNSYYKYIGLYNNGYGNINYICGKGFRNISKTELNKLIKIYYKLKVNNKYFGIGLNIFNQKKRNEYYVHKSITKVSKNNFIKNIYNINYDKNTLKLINKFNKDVFTNIIKFQKKIYKKILKKNLKKIIY